MITFDVKVDRGTLANFDRAWKQYLELNTKKSVTDLANQTCYFVARNAMNTTDAATKEEIEADLRKPSNINPKAPIAAILVNKQRALKGKTKGSRKGLAREAMKEAVDKFIRARQKTRNFLRAGWQASIKAIEPFVRVKGGAPKYKRVTTKGAKKGGAKPAKDNSLFKGVAIIWNSVQGGLSPSPKVQAIITQGLNLAVIQETGSKMRYNARKLLERGIKQFNQSR